MIKVIRLHSDNFEGSLMTPEVYYEIKLQMSTGDFHTHKAEEIEVESYDGVLELADIRECVDCSCK